VLDWIGPDPIRFSYAGSDFPKHLVDLTR
jgi:hypothetical protein